MSSHYASDEIVALVFNRRSTGAHYIYSQAEANDQFFAALHEINWIIEALTQIHSIRGTISFAITASRSPFQVTQVAQDHFLVLVDQRAFYYLLTFCIRMQSFPELSGHLAQKAIPETRDYRGKYLLDITKDIVFHTPDISHLDISTQGRLVYQAALAYIISHEVAHISHGHLEFKTSPDFKEFTTTDNERDITLRTLEMDADSSATTSVFAIFERIFDLITQRKIPEPFASAEDFRFNIRLQYITGMFVAIIFLDTLTLNFNPKKYPTSYARFLTINGIMQILMQRHAPTEVHLPETVRQLIVDCFVSLSGALENLGHPIASNVIIYDDTLGLPRFAYDDIGVMIGQGELEPLYSRWSRLRPFLEKYQRGGTLAPAIATPN